jgi:hypothetical protein
VSIANTQALPWRRGEDELVREEGTGYEEKKHGTGLRLQLPVGESIFGRTSNGFEVEC